jgi:hypothetical protein
VEGKEVKEVGYGYRKERTRRIRSSNNIRRRGSEKKQRRLKSDATRGRQRR